MHLTGLIVLGFVAWVIVLALLWRAHRWLLFYIVGALGTIVFVVLVTGATGWDAALEGLEARQVLAVATRLGLSLDVLGSAGLAVKNHAGWGVFDIGVECSGLMEMTAMAGLVLFYPAVFDAPRKAFVIVVGTLLTYLFNLARILLIVQIIAQMGTAWVYPAHAIFGRLFFFVATVALYWRLVTVPTLGHVGKRLGEAGE